MYQHTVDTVTCRILPSCIWTRLSDFLHQVSTNFKVPCNAC